MCEELPITKTTEEVQRFLGLTGYFRRFINNYATLEISLNKLLKKDAKFEKEEYTAFEQLKKLITQKPVSMIYQFGLETDVHTDASNQALAAILLQRSNEDNQLHTVQYMSLKTTETQQRWISYELEGKQESLLHPIPIHGKGIH